MAFTQGTGEMTLHGKLLFENGGVPLERDNFAFCQVIDKFGSGTLKLICLAVGRAKP